MEQTMLELEPVQSKTSRNIPVAEIHKARLLQQMADAITAVHQAPRSMRRFDDEQRGARARQGVSDDVAQ